jgi:hypothetical protein
MQRKIRAAPCFERAPGFPLYELGRFLLRILTSLIVLTLPRLVLAMLTLSGLLAVLTLTGLLRLAWHPFVLLLLIILPVGVCHNCSFVRLCGVWARWVGLLDG